MDLRYTFPPQVAPPECEALARAIFWRLVAAAVVWWLK